MKLLFSIPSDDSGISFGLLHGIIAVLYGVTVRLLASLMAKTDVIGSPGGQ